MFNTFQLQTEGLVSSGQKYPLIDPVRSVLVTADKAFNMFFSLYLSLSYEGSLHVELEPNRKNFF